MFAGFLTETMSVCLIVLIVLLLSSKISDRTGPGIQGAISISVNLLARTHRLQPLQASRTPQATDRVRVDGSIR
jgi:hypothetical protein